MSQDTPRKIRTDLFDIRNVIGALLLIYGVVLVIVSFTTSDADKAKADGVNANLWVGVSLLLFGGFLVGWALLRPIVVDEKQLEEDKKAVDEAAGRPTDTSGSVD